ncbi:hypothetical protein EJ110_NYTH03328 [Nymphaea thermarum]|nr:hypothetical protein EJ110_NYTH03328 [Nymphaea thermarum]
MGHSGELGSVGWMVVSLRRAKDLIATASFFISFFLLIGVFVAFQWLDQSILASNWLRNLFRTIGSSQRYLLECPAGKDPGLCAVAPAPVVQTFRPGPACPDYFRWIHEDLRPWKRSGITREMVESGQRLSHFRLVILDGKAYVETYRRSFQTRDLFTIWGILQLLQWYPGQIPDLDLMFNCEDVPVVQTRNFGDKGLVPPPVFHYCGDDATHDVVFPDWSFWGWPEVNIKPWVPLLEDLSAGNGRIKWKDRDPTAYWRGNPGLPHRQELVKSLMPSHHFWPISADTKCPSIKFAVDWGNTHPQKAQEIGKAGSGFIMNDLKMENVYDYMFHSLTEYAKLLKYKPTIPTNAKQVCLGSMACPQRGRAQQFLNESMVKHARDEGPCALLPPDPAAIESLMTSKNESVKQVHEWEQEAWKKQKMTT